LRGAETIDGLGALLQIALESQRPADELLQLVLNGSLPLAGAETAVVCGPDGEIVAAAPSTHRAVDEIRELAREACKSWQRDQRKDVYISRLAIDPPYLFAMRWARGTMARPDVAEAIADVAARLLSRDEGPGASARPFGLDPLTGLPSRAATLKHLDDVLTAAARTGGQVGVLFIDLDGFKNVNDTFGHAAGDAALADAAAMMREAVRRGDLVGRLGGDEFLAVLGVVTDEREMAEAAERFLERVFVKVEDDGVTRDVGTSIGVAVSPQDGTTAEALISHADEAMYAAKRAGGRCIRWYRDGVGQEIRMRRDLRERLRAADVERDFLVCYQPIVSAATMHVVGAEALVRWRHPSRGWLAPRTFMPAANTHAIQQVIDTFVVGEVLQTLRHWVEDGLDVRVHINLTSTDELVCAEIESALDGGGALLQRLAIEMPEAAATADPERVGAFLRRMRRLGVLLGLDGFAVEPTSFEVLADFQLDFLKIDRRVTQLAPRDERAQRIARTAILVARSFGLRPLAEGVESSEHAKWLADSGVEELQGYFFRSADDGAGFRRLAAGAPENRPGDVIRRRRAGRRDRRGARPKSRPGAPLRRSPRGVRPAPQPAPRP
jgi:diguanylate cyclase (GGDEF)-like protein